ncbi:Predicted oxidoreductase [Granulicatella balaenopterae]|uniref:Predicted oxidoreductase n=1 Tax=Granulicatella balaenopterae TaxID=137733 RepID=A0A1H9MK00_9LACT|nr:aldo/keto reductase [Granulicatella balaenopterae]SER23787.1 Predicted oxidoreductase [Granulicatella balaenopterae]
MQQITLGKSMLRAPRIGLGCMRMAQLEVHEAVEVLEQALELGINFFDHADIYGDGESERIFGAAMKRMNIPRESILVQSKCGICQGYYDFSKEHIVASVDETLHRLQMDYLDVLVLHRPDVLMDPEEVADAFEELLRTGKVRYFGVSNFNSLQIELLQRACYMPLIINQVQFSLAHTPLIDAGVNVNTKNDRAVMRDCQLLDYCRLNEVSIQVWSPFQIDLAHGVFFDHEDYKKLNTVIHDLAKKYRVSDEAIAIAWILRHPAKMQPIVGTMNMVRLRGLVKALDIELSREDWYKLYCAAGNKLL